MPRKAIPFIVLPLVFAACSPAIAQTGAGNPNDPWCRDSDGGNRGRYCEVREQTLPARSSISVDAGRNGGVHVQAWDRNQILVRAKVQAWDDSDKDARALADQIRIRTDDVIEADGPQTRRRAGWSVSYEISVPRQTDLDLEAHNGGIGIDGVRGKLRFETVNGGVHLASIGGDVQGETRNGGLHVELTGNGWDGQGLDVETTNGGINLAVPDAYSAHLVTGTVNGRMQIDFPVMVRGVINHRIETDLGKGGATIRVTTRNGGVRVSRQG
ncbi:MAG: hypothetical protein P8099_14480 [Gemmatimonadota bacterium]